MPVVDDLFPERSATFIICFNHRAKIEVDEDGERGREGVCERLMARWDRGGIDDSRGDISGKGNEKVENEGQD